VKGRISGPDAGGKRTARCPQERILSHTADVRAAFAAIRPVLAADFDRGGVERGDVSALNGLGRHPQAVAAEAERGAE
jgi:hypothetical protein